MRLSRHAQLIKSIFEFFRRLNKPIFPGLRWLAKQIKASTRTVQRALKELREAGLVTSARRYRRSSMHELCDPAQMSFDFAAVDSAAIPRKEAPKQPELSGDRCAGQARSSVASSQPGASLGASLGATVVKPLSHRESTTVRSTGVDVFVCKRGRENPSLLNQKIERTGGWARVGELLKAGIPGMEAIARVLGSEA